MKNRLCKVSKFTHKIQNLALSASLALGASMCAMSAYADPNAKTAMSEAVVMIGKVVCIPGVLFLILGVVHYASANSEGDGPAKHKAIQQMAGGLTMSLISRVYYEDINHSLSDSYKTKIIKQAKLLMQEDMSHNRSLEEIAEYLGMSYSTFRRDFKAACGMSPGQYRLELKIIKAKELLYSTKMSIADISSDLFFENSGQFSNFFKKKVGVSPFEYRKRMANKDNNS